jgi:hypothetical protein
MVNYSQRPAVLPNNRLEDGKHHYQQSKEIIMRTITNTFTVYTFDELPEEAKQLAIQNYWDINVDYEWWDFTYEDVATIGLKIEGFDVAGNKYVEGKLTEYAIEVARNILKDHGPMTETYKLAEQYLQDRKEVIALERIADAQLFADDLCKAGKDDFQWNGLIYQNYVLDDEDIDTEDIDQEFERALKEEYASILQNEYEFLTSEEQIIETMTANEYDFTIDGKIYKTRRTQSC